MKKVLLTPGPTYVEKKNYLQLGKKNIAPDLDLEFFGDYYRLCRKISLMAGMIGETFILAGEGMLGLDASLASLIGKDDHVLVLDNGVYGHYFVDMVGIYTDNVEVYQDQHNSSFDLVKLEKYLENKSFDIATLVYVDTPTGLKNNVKDIAEILSKKGIMIILDAVSALGIEPLEATNWNIDVVIGASQKALSAPTGLATVSLSPRACDKISKRKTIIPYYLDLSKFFSYYKDKLFPYTMPTDLIYMLDYAVENLIDRAKCEKMASIIRQILIQEGIELFLEKDFATGVSAFYPPIPVPEFIEKMDQQGVLISPSLETYANTLVRIGHMGHNVNYNFLFKFFKALDKILSRKGQIVTNFIRLYKESFGEE